MKYTKFLGSIFDSVEWIKIEEEHIKNPEAVEHQICMWRIPLVEGGYSHKEVSKIQDVIRDYLGLPSPEITEEPDLPYYYDEDEEESSIDEYVPRAWTEDYLNTLGMSIGDFL